MAFNDIWESKVDFDDSAVETIKVNGVAVSGFTADKTEYNYDLVKNTYTGVPTIFRHKLSQIVDVTFKTDKDYANPLRYPAKTAGFLPLQ